MSHDGKVVLVPHGEDPFTLLRVSTCHPLNAAARTKVFEAAKSVIKHELPGQGAACIDLVERMPDVPPVLYARTAIIYFAFVAFEKFQSWLCPPRGFSPGTRLDVLRFSMKQTMQTLATGGARRFVPKGELLMDGQEAREDEHELVPASFLLQNGLVADFTGTLEWTIQSSKDLILGRDFSGAWTSKLRERMQQSMPPERMELKYIPTDSTDSSDGEGESG